MTLISIYCFQIVPMINLVLPIKVKASFQYSLKFRFLFWSLVSSIFKGSLKTIFLIRFELI